MNNTIKSELEFVNEIELNYEIGQSKTTLSDRVDEISGSDATGGRLLDGFYELEMPSPIPITCDSNQSIEGKSSLRGSFQNNIRASIFGKLIQALPIPTFLIDKELNIAFLSQACSRFTPGYDQMLGKTFLHFFLTPEASGTAESIIHRVFVDGKPRAGEGRLRINNSVIWARMTFRSMRMENERFVLILVEDLTREINQVCENEILRRELEHRVQQRTAQLRKINEDLRNEIADRRWAELKQMKTPSSFVPICASCKKIQSDHGYWIQVEAYIRDNTKVDFTHSICPECAKKLYSRVPFDGGQ